MNKEELAINLWRDKDLDLTKDQAKAVAEMVSKEISTAELVEELKKREEVSSLVVETYEKYVIRTGDDIEQTLDYGAGPAIILVVKD